MFTNSETAFESWSPGDGQRQHGPALCWTAPSNSGLPKLNQLDVLCLYMIIYRYIIVIYALDMQIVQISHGVMKLSIRPDQLVRGHLLLHIWLSRGCRLRFWWRYSQWINIKGSRKNTGNFQGSRSNAASWPDQSYVWKGCWYVAYAYAILCLSSAKKDSSFVVTGLCKGWAVSLYSIRNGRNIQKELALIKWIATSSINWQKVLYIVHGRTHGFTS